MAAQTQLTSTNDATNATNQPDSTSTPLDEELDQIEMTKRARSAKHHKKWIRRLKIFFCCLGYKKNKDSIADVASIFAEFYADLEVPASDLAAGFVLLSKYQAAQRQWMMDNQQMGVQEYLSSVPITAQTNFLDISTADDSHLINDLIYYMNYSLAIFGWPMQMIDDPCMLCCICPYLKLSPCCSRGKRRRLQAPTQDPKQPRDKKKPDHQQPQKKESVTGQLSDDWDMPVILEDNCCGCNVASVERRLAAHNYEIIYVSYKVNVNVVPFLVAADHSKQSVVVAMRGSMSLSDMITDMNGQTDKIPIENCPDDWLSHRGITRAANYVKTTLIGEHILDRAFNCRPDLGSQDYNLIFCGHSLGAGVAAILGILMRPLYPDLKAYLYSPPGGVLSLPAVEYTKKFAIGILLGNDCVPRLGVAQLERLRYYILLSLKSSETSSGRILARALLPSCCTSGNEVDYDPSQSLNLLHGTEGRSFDYNGGKIPFQVQPQVLYVPGKLIHIVKNHTFKSKARRFFNEPIYQAIWNDNIVYDRIMISEGMFYDHLPNNLMHAMKMLFSKTLPARRESKASNSTPIVGINLPCADDISDESTKNPEAGQHKSSGAVKQVDEVADEETGSTKGTIQYPIVIKDDNNNINKAGNTVNEVTLEENNHSDKERLSDAKTLILQHGLDSNGNDVAVTNRNSYS